MMKSFITSYTGLFANPAPKVDRIEIPLIQRDYAQGRSGDAVERIRTSFLDVLHAGVTGPEPVSLDFIYGDVIDGTFRPLDGQQRLTTLFLLHWYLAARATQRPAGEQWRAFTYATRSSARLFCERLVECSPPTEIASLSTWVVDQTWFLYTWKHDPTVQSMLVMLDAIHDRFRGDDCGAAWARLNDPATPAIAFHVLPVQGMALGEDLYIKMNSRGKPLTPFENFKARFLQLLESWCEPARLQQIALKLDGVWSDVFWPYRGDDDLVDDELMRFFHFVTEVCEWKDGAIEDDEGAKVSVEVRAERVFGEANPKRSEHLDFLTAAFDTWVGEDVPARFGEFFTRTRDGSDRVLLFGAEGRVEIDLFSACLRGAGEWAGKKRLFSLPETLLLYGVLVARLERAAALPRRLRTLRNLIEASSNEIRGERMPALLDDVRRIVAGGTLAGVAAFNMAHVSEEQAKAALLERSPSLQTALFALEDHPILRGALAAFELDVDVSTFEARSAAFARLFADASDWPAITGALLALGDYSRRTRSFFQLGSGVGEARWRQVFTAPAARSPIDQTRSVLAALLDEVANSPDALAGCLARIQTEWLTSQTAYDWRFYFVKYPAMREGQSGIYVSASDSLGFDVCMLDKTQLNSNYRDPYLHAIHRESGVGNAVERRMFTGYATTARWMVLAKSRTELRCVPEGISLKPPTPEHTDTFTRVCREHGIGDDLLLRIPQRDVNGGKADTRDRVVVAANLVRDLVAAGL